MANKHGNCPSCKRENVLMPGPKCSRCYDRIKRGVHVITGEPLKLLRSHDLEPAKTAVATKTRPAQPETMPTAPTTGFNLDILAAIDEAWFGKREAVLLQLKATDKTADKLRLALNVLSSVNTLGIGA